MATATIPVTTRRRRGSRAWAAVAFALAVPGAACTPPTPPTTPNSVPAFTAQLADVPVRFPTTVVALPYVWRSDYAVPTVTLPGPVARVAAQEVAVVDGAGPVQVTIDERHDTTTIGQVSYTCQSNGETTTITSDVQIEWWLSGEVLQATARPADRAVDLLQPQVTVSARLLFPGLGNLNAPIGEVNKPIPQATITYSV